MHLDCTTEALIARHARSNLPYRACGVISGPRGERKIADENLKVWRAENAADRPMRQWLIAPTEQLALLRQIEAKGHELVAIWHSVASGERAEPSKLDRELAEGWPELSHVIVSIEGASCDRCSGHGCVGIPDEEDDKCPKCEGRGFEPDFWVGNLRSSAFLDVNE